MAAGLDPGPLGKEAGQGRGGRAWRAVLLALAAGWGAFLAYSAVFLTEDPPLRHAAVADRETTSGLDFPAPGSAPLQTARRVAYGLDEPRPDTAPSADPPATHPASVARATAAEPPIQPGRTGALPEAVATAPPTERMAAERLDHIGVWGPNAAACGARHRRRGYYQAIITLERAKAGRTVCTFHDGRRIGNAWVTAAECSDRGRHWSSQVRLVVEGDRLTWSSARGTASYIRCGRRPG
ncbi:hypothetical protein MTDSW087_02151 [Methylobacterium dankookense]|uniref:Peptidase inhibitor family I36 protein n=2 Tax=Methylobacterium dankookense TaxID=560405 RepID=A0A564FWC2_9HYPH|nr:hypothetical protein IFDJLNFL_5095 [Methylobacterium dankookense]VUF12459.1 hypothetical protein MTDSW087_02151 [Methylobacterium dankookense]